MSRETHVFEKHPDGIFWKIDNGELPAPPAAQVLGMNVVNVDVAKGTINVEFTATKSHTNPAGQIQGGFLAAMIDDTLAPCLLATLEAQQICVTLNLNCSYIRPAMPGKINGFGTIAARTGKTAVVNGELRQEGKLLLTASSTQIIQRIG